MKRRNSAKLALIGLVSLSILLPSIVAGLPGLWTVAPTTLLSGVPLAVWAVVGLLVALVLLAGLSARISVEDDETHDREPK